MGDASREAKRRYYRRHRARILRQQAEYRTGKRQDAAFARRLAENTRRWRRRFEEEMRSQGYAGREGRGLSPEGYRYRADNGLDVPAWPLLVDASKARRRRI